MAASTLLPSTYWGGYFGWIFNEGLLDNTFLDATRVVLQKSLFDQEWKHLKNENLFICIVIIYYRQQLILRTFTRNILYS